MNILDLLLGVDKTTAEPAPPRELPGRNEPCWCGSGKKYKACHAPQDERLREQERARQRACTTFT